MSCHEGPITFLYTGDKFEKVIHFLDQENVIGTDPFRPGSLALSLIIDLRNKQNCCDII